MVGTPCCKRRREGVRLTAALQLLAGKSGTVFVPGRITDLPSHPAERLGSGGLGCESPPPGSRSPPSKTASLCDPSSAAVGVDVAMAVDAAGRRVLADPHRLAYPGAPLGCWPRRIMPAARAPRVMNLVESKPDCGYPASHPASRPRLSPRELPGWTSVHGPPRVGGSARPRPTACLACGAATGPPRGFEFNRPPLRNRCR